jgi:hypothetical protein
MEWDGWLEKMKAGDCAQWVDHTTIASTVARSQNKDALTVGIHIFKKLENDTLFPTVTKLSRPGCFIWDSPRTCLVLGCKEDSNQRASAPLLPKQNERLSAI